MNSPSNASSELRHTARPYAGRFWQQYVIHMRPYLMFVSGITGIAGLSYAADFSTLFGLFLGLSFFLSYGFSQALTDCFQTDTDSISSPYRPLVRGTVGWGDVFAVSLVGTSVCGLVMVVGNPTVLPLVFVGIAGLLTYTFFKRRWWAGPFYNAWIVALLYLLGVLDGSPGRGISALGHPAILATAAGVFFGYANFVLTGYFKDISADRATGYDTLPVRYGMRLSSIVSDVFAAAAVIFVGAAIYLVTTGGGVGSSDAIPIAVAITGAVVALVAQIRLHRVTDEKDAHRAINPVVHAYVILLSGITIANRPSWSLFVAAFYLGFWITMRRRPATQQI